MFTNLLFILLALGGLMIFYALAQRIPETDRKKWRLLGLAVFHVGVFGLLSRFLPTYFLVSLLLFELGILVWWNPLKLLNENYRKQTTLAGSLLVLAAIVINVSYLTSFSLWFWTVPVVLYLFSSLIKSLGTYNRWLRMVAGLLAVIYLLIIGDRALKEWQPIETKKEGATEQAASTDMASPVSRPAPTPPPGPLSNAIQEIDVKLQTLEKENARLQKEIEGLKEENAQLKKTLEENSRKLDEIRKVL